MFNLTRFTFILCYLYFLIQIPNTEDYTFSLLKTRFYSFSSQNNFLFCQCNDGVLHLHKHQQGKLNMANNQLCEGFNL